MQKEQKTTKRIIKQLTFISKKFNKIATIIIDSHYRGIPPHLALFYKVKLLGVIENEYSGRQHLDIFLYDCTSNDIKKIEEATNKHDTFKNLGIHYFKYIYAALLKNNKIDIKKNSIETIIQIKKNLLYNIDLLQLMRDNKSFILNKNIDSLKKEPFTEIREIDDYLYFSKTIIN